jgi:hypothetical protein
MRIAKTLEAEMRQVLWERESTGSKVDESSTGRVGAYRFQHITTRYRLARSFETYKPFPS